MATVRRKQLLRNVGRRVAELRTERGLTQEELAARLGMSDRYLRRLEAGEINMSIWALARLANALGATIDEILVRPRKRAERASAGVD